MQQSPYGEALLAGPAPVISQYTVPAETLAPNPFDTRTPLQQVYFWTPDQWEQFTFEWVSMRASHEGYAGVELIGGSNDRGADVVAFRTDRKLNGDWHCYQCKHYRDELTLTHALPEMLKPFVAAVETTRRLPSRYTFVAPQLAPRLVDTVLTPDELKKQFLNYLSRSPKPVRELDPAVLTAVEALAAKDTFSWFWTVNLSKILEIYRHSRLFVERFNLPPSGKPAKLPVPPEPDETLETRFLTQLLEVYRGYFGTHIVTLADAFAHIEAGEHLGRQRVAFYAAESLRMYARESIPGDVYEELQDDVLAVLVEVAIRRFPSGFDRLQEVLLKATDVPAHSPLLEKHFKNLERIGMCHQFANDRKLSWSRKGDGQ